MNATAENIKQPQRASTVVSSISIERKILKKAKIKARKDGRTLSSHVQYLIQRDLESKAA